FHPFPTRRSSDLLHPLGGGGELGDRLLVGGVQLQHARSPAAAPGGVRPGQHVPVAGDGGDVGGGDGGAGGGEVVDDDGTGEQGGDGPGELVARRDDVQQPAPPGRGRPVLRGAGRGGGDDEADLAQVLVPGAPDGVDGDVGGLDDGGVGVGAEDGGHGRLVPVLDGERVGQRAAQPGDPVGRLEQGAGAVLAGEGKLEGVAAGLPGAALGVGGALRLDERGDGGLGGVELGERRLVRLV